MSISPTPSPSSPNSPRDRIPVMCATCGYFFEGSPAEIVVGRAYAFLYHRPGTEPLSIDREDFQEHFEEVVLDMGNDTSDRASAALAYALTMAGNWPEAEDLQAAVLHHQTHETAEEE